MAGGVQWLEVVPGNGADTVTGQFDGARLTFFRLGDSWIALAPSRAGGQTSAEAWVTIHRGRDRSVLVRRLPVTRRTFGTSRLTVDPQFTEAPRGELARRIARERALVAPLGAAALGTPPLFDAPFVRPASGPRTAGFGVRRTFNGATRSRHYGVDFDGAIGDAVVAANRGVVVLVGDFFYSGISVYVNHGGGLISAYFHLSDALVSDGDTVAPGQPIGRIGRSGRATGPHLHWLVRVGDRPVDGETLLALPVPASAGSAGRTSGAELRP